MNTQTSQVFGIAWYTYIVEAWMKREIVVEIDEKLGMKYNKKSLKWLQIDNILDYLYPVDVLM